MSFSRAKAVQVFQQPLYKLRLSWALDRFPKTRSTPGKASFLLGPYSSCPRILGDKGNWWEHATLLVQSNTVLRLSFRTLLYSTCLSETAASEEIPQFSVFDKLLSSRRFLHLENIFFFLNFTSWVSFGSRSLINKSNFSANCSIISKIPLRVHLNPMAYYLTNFRFLNLRGKTHTHTCNKVCSLSTWKI